MENVATPEALMSRWQEMLREPMLHDLPYKIELNAWGIIEMLPLTVRRGLLMPPLAAALKNQLPGGTVMMNCVVLTTIGIRVADVAWVSAGLFAVQGERTPYTRAPEICVEIAAPDGEEKAAAYLAAGAHEVWLVAEDGTVRYLDSQGEKPVSDFPVAITLPLPMKGTP